MRRQVQSTVRLAIAFITLCMIACTSGRTRPEPKVPKAAPSPPRESPGLGSENEASATPLDKVEKFEEERDRGTLGGRVVDWVSGMPCRAAIYFESDRPRKDAFEIGSEATTDAEGLFELRHLKPSTYNLLVSTEDGRFGALTGLTVISGQASKGNTVYVSPGADLNIRYDGSLAGAQFSITCLGATLQPAWVSADGPIMKSVPAGPVSIDFRARSSRPLMLSFDSNGRPLQLKLTPHEVREIVLHDDG